LRRTRLFSHLVHGLGQEVIGTGLKALQAVGRLIQRRHHDDRQMRRLRRALEVLAHLETVHTRHHYIEQHDIAIAPFADRDGIRAICGSADVEILSRQPHFQKLDVRKQVINDQDPCCHYEFAPANC
jgi:hypothetical protein